ncbi:MAG: glutaminase, partial [Planctomycetaceae bacterium]|nr:glutaminase [Planctomycetaceae bacterium]
GVGGGIVAVVPGVLGIGLYSPKLDAKGNSVRGVEACKELSRRFGLHAFEAEFSGPSLLDLFALNRVRWVPTVYYHTPVTDVRVSILVCEPRTSVTGVCFVGISVISRPFAARTASLMRPTTRYYQGTQDLTQNGAPWST